MIPLGSKFRHLVSIKKVKHKSLKYKVKYLNLGSVYWSVEKETLLFLERKTDVAVLSILIQSWIILFKESAWFKKKINNGRYVFFVMIFYNTK